MSLNVTETLQITDTVTEVLSLGGATPGVQQIVSPQLTYANGTGASNIQENCVLVGVTVAASATQTYTLSAMTDSLGRSIAFATIRKMLVYPTTITAGDTYTIAPGATHGWTAFLGGTSPTVTALSGIFLIATTAATAWAVVASSTDQISITNNGSHSMIFTFAFSGQ